MHSNSTQCRIVHKEYIADVSSSILFTLTSYYLNPGVAATFPWLSNIASNFETYRFMGLMFEFKSTSADALNSTNTALGTVIMAADYNAGSPVPLNKMQMEQAMWSISTKPSVSALAPIECAPKENPMATMYIRNAAAGSTATGMDLRFTDLCRFDFATVGSQAAAVIGELWVTYDVVLSKPILNYGAPSTTFSAHFGATAGIANATPLGTQVTKYNNMQVTATTTVITFPAQVCGNFLITIIWTGGATVGVAPSLTYANCTPLLLQQNDASASTFTNSGAGFQEYAITISVPLSTTASTVTLGTGGTISTTSCDLFITQMNSSLTT